MLTPTTTPPSIPTLPTHFSRATPPPTMVLSGCNRIVGLPGGLRSGLVRSRPGELCWRPHSGTLVAVLLVCCGISSLLTRPPGGNRSFIRVVVVWAWSCPGGLQSGLASWTTPGRIGPPIRALLLRSFGWVVAMHWSGLSVVIPHSSEWLCVRACLAWLGPNHQGLGAFG